MDVDKIFTLIKRYCDNNNLKIPDITSIYQMLEYIHDHYDFKLFALKINTDKYHLEDITFFIKGYEEYKYYIRYVPIPQLIKLLRADTLTELLK
jgi:hypothetical protein